MKLSDLENDPPGLRVWRIRTHLVPRISIWRPDLAMVTPSVTISTWAARPRAAYSAARARRCWLAANQAELLAAKSPRRSGDRPVIPGHMKPRASPDRRAADRSATSFQRLRPNGAMRAGHRLTALTGVTALATLHSNVAKTSPAGPGRHRRLQVRPADVAAADRALQYIETSYHRTARR